MYCAKCSTLIESPAPPDALCPACQEEKVKRDLEIVELAKSLFQDDGVIEFDDDAKVSEGKDNGAYVQAWRWIDFSGTKFDKESGLQDKPKQQQFD